MAKKKLPLSPQRVLARRLIGVGAVLVGAAMPWLWHALGGFLAGELEAGRTLRGKAALASYLAEHGWIGWVIAIVCVIAGILWIANASNPSFEED